MSPLKLRSGEADLLKHFGGVWGWELLLFLLYLICWFHGYILFQGRFRGYWCLNCCFWRFGSSRLFLEDAWLYWLLFRKIMKFSLNLIFWLFLMILILCIEACQWFLLRNTPRLSSSCPILPHWWWRLGDRTCIWFWQYLPFGLNLLLSGMIMSNFVRMLES